MNIIRYIFLAVLIAFCAYQVVRFTISLVRSIRARRLARKNKDVHSLPEEDVNK